MAKFGGVSGDQLRSIIERVEKLEEEKAAIAADIREVFAEAKGNGFDVKALRQIIKLRKMELSERQEQDMVLETYQKALGMLPLLEGLDEPEPEPEPMLLHVSDDELYKDAIAVVIRDNRPSTSYIQRRLGLGYNRAARLMERMEREGVVSAIDHVGKRQVLRTEMAA